MGYVDSPATKYYLDIFVSVLQRYQVKMLVKLNSCVYCISKSRVPEH